MKRPNRLAIIAITILSIIVAVLWFQNNQLQKKEAQANQELRKEILSKDSLQNLGNGFYRKLVSDSLVLKELKKLAEDIVDLKERKPIAVTKTIIRPIEVLKEIDSVEVKKDSVFITDYYPNKDTSFLTYTNRFSLSQQKGISNFKFDSIVLNKVVSKKENGLYQIDFKGPDFLKLESLDIQTEPIKEVKKDNFGVIIGLNYIRSLEDNQQHLGIDSYIRYKKFYIGGGATTQRDINAGVKVEF